MRWISLVLICLLVPTVSAQDPLDSFHILGDENAPITIIEYGNYQSPSCYQFWDETFLSIQTEYIDTGLVNFMFEDYPLGFYQNSQKAAEAAECVGEQSEEDYWYMHDFLYISQDEWAESDDASTLFMEYATELELDVNAFTICLFSDKYEEEVLNDMAEAQTLGVTGTPTFFILSQYEPVTLVGAQQFSVFQSAIDSILGVDTVPSTKYDSIEYNVMAEGTLDYGNYDPINPKDIFYSDEVQAVQAIAFNRLDGYIDLKFDLYQDNNFITSYTGWAEGDGRPWYHSLTINFYELPVSDISGNWEIYTYIDGEYELYNKFSIVDVSSPSTDYTSPFLASIFLYAVFVIPYIVIQKLRKNNLRSKTMIIGGLSFCGLILIAILGDESTSGAETVVFLIGALLISGTIHLIGPRGKQKSVEEQPTVIDKEIPKEEPKPKEKPVVKKKCPYCDGKLSELNYFKLKAGNDVPCEYCGEMIEG